MKPRILVIDDDEAVLQSCATILEDANYEVETAPVPEAGLKLLEQREFHLALVDFKLPRMNGIKVLELVLRLQPGVAVIIFTAYATIESAVEAVKKGAFNYIPKPFTASQLLSVVAKGLEHNKSLRETQPIRRNLEECCPLHHIVGQSAVLEEILATVAKVAPSEANVLITGASGTGKELIARAIHANSRRSRQPFIDVDCAALPPNLLESELFGHEKGAFTGATQAKRGLLEMAHGGTIFFDEIGELSAELQAKLLRALQERTFRRLGSEKQVIVDIRITSSTNRDLQLEAQQGRFRQDLLYRLNVVTLTLPALCDRPGDLQLLVPHFIRTFARAANKGAVDISPDAMQLLEGYIWPGNVRELRNVVERAVVLCDDGMIRPRDLPEHILRQQPSQKRVDGQLGYKGLREHWIDSQGREYLTALLRRHAGNISAAAREAQISRKSLYELLRRFEIEGRSSQSDSPPAPPAGVTFS